MTHVALVHGGGDVGSAFHLLEPELHARGLTSSAVDLPLDDPAADLGTLADAVVDGTGGAEDVLVVAHSWGGFVAPLVVDRLGGAARGLVMLAAMVPLPGETPDEWWAATGHDASFDGDPLDVFYGGVPRDVAAAALANGRDQLEHLGREPWPLDAWPEVPTYALLAEDDRVFPLAWMRGVIRDRLGIEADTVPGGHVVFLAEPALVADHLAAYAAHPPLA